MNRIYLIYFVLFLSVFQAKAADDNSISRTEANIIKAKLKIEHAGADNWKVRADEAKRLMDLQIICPEEIDWLNKSIAINENYYNLTLLGDYYRLSLDFPRAYENYLKAINLAQKNNHREAIPAIQWKLLITTGTKNYSDFQKKQQER